MSARPPSLPPPPPQPYSDGDPITWDSRAWVARSPDGRETTGAVSLAQISRAFQKGVLGPDVVISRSSEEGWENIRIVLSRYAHLASAKSASGRRADSESNIAPELTLTVQRDAMVRPPSPSRTELDQPVPPPLAARPEPSSVVAASRFASRGPSGAEMLPLTAHLFDVTFATPITPRIARHLYTVVVFLAATSVVTGIGAAVFALVTREGSLAAELVVALAWALGGAAAGLALLVGGRIVIEALLAIFALRAGVEELRARNPPDSE